MYFSVVLIQVAYLQMENFCSIYTLLRNSVAIFVVYYLITSDYGFLNVRSGTCSKPQANIHICKVNVKKRTVCNV